MPSTYQEEKDKGASCWKVEDFAGAVQHYSSALALAGDDKSLQKTMFSNRSACYLKLKDKTRALEDALACTKIDASFTKGHIRVGDCYYAMARYTESYNAYNSASQLEPGDASTKEKAEKAMAAVRAASAPPPPRATATSATDNSLSGRLQRLGSIAVVISFLLAMLPFTGRFGGMCWKVFLVTGIAKRLYPLYKQHGMIKFTQDYAQRILRDPIFMHAVLCGMLLTTKPYLLGGAPLLFTEVAMFSAAIFDYARGNVDLMRPQLQALVAKYQPSLAGQDPALFFTPQASSRFSSEVNRFGALCEVYMGIYLLVEIVMPSRNIVFTYVWWQYLQMRYFIDPSGNIKAAFYSVDARISGLLASRMCPNIVRVGYSYVKKALARQVDPASASARQSSRCSVM